MERIASSRILGLVFLISIKSSSYGQSVRHSVIKFLQPDRTIAFEKKINSIVEFANKTEKELGLEWSIAIALIFQESRFKTDPHKCQTSNKKCTVDLGISQINWKLWNTVFPIDRKRLSTDYEYALQISFKILKHYHSKYSNKVTRWYEYYHSGLPSNRLKYRKHLKSHYDKIKVYERGYLDARNDYRRIRGNNLHSNKFRQTDIYSSHTKKSLCTLKRGR